MRISDWSSDVCSSDLPDLKDFKVDGSVTLSRFGGGTSNAVTNNEQRLFVSAPLANDRLGLSLSGVRTFHSGFLTDISPGSDGHYGRSLTENLAAKLLWEPNASIRVALSARHSHLDPETGRATQKRRSRQFHRAAHSSPSSQHTPH